MILMILCAFLTVGGGMLAGQGGVTAWAGRPWVETAGLVGEEHSPSEAEAGEICVKWLLLHRFR